LFGIARQLRAQSDQQSFGFVTMANTVEERLFAWTMAHTTPRRRRTQVPGQYLGFSLQQTRFLQLLLRASAGTTISLEVFDDVGAELPQRRKTAGQVKSALATNPIADRASDLWKTFRNWHDAASAGDLDPRRTIFEIYVAQPKTGNLVHAFSRAQSLDDAANALENARTALWGAAPKYDLRRTLPKNLAEHCQVVLDPANKILPGIIKNFRLECGTGDPLGDAKKLMQSPLIPTEIAEVAFPHALGWIKQRTDDLLQRQLPARVTYDEFATEMRAFVRKIDLRRILISYAPTPAKETVEANRIRTYVQQLELIDVSEEDKIQAINDCLRAEIDRTQWSTQGIIHESSLDDLWNTLSSFWKNKNAQNAITHKHLTHVEQGSLLYRDCMLLRVPLEGLEVPNHFTPGSFHTLADGEEVGWHREYKTLLARRRDGSPR
jgi:hypothetical protein